MEEFIGKRCVVTGASSGIGAAVARILTERGAGVVSLDVKPPLDAALDHVLCDLADPASIDAALARLDGTWHALLNIAGVPGTLSAEVVLKVNALGLRHLTEALLPRIVDGGAIVNVASLAARGWVDHVDAITGFLGAPGFSGGLRWWNEHRPALPAYDFSKEVVLFYTMELSQRAWGRGVRVNAINPGPVRTPILGAFEESIGLERMELVRRIVGRHAEPEDIAKVAVFLAEPDSGWLNGVDIPVDGGALAGVRIAQKRNSLSHE